MWVAAPGAITADIAKSALVGAAAGCRPWIATMRIWQSPGKNNIAIPMQSEASENGDILTLDFERDFKEGFDYCDGGTDAPVCGSASRDRAVLDR